MRGRAWRWPGASERRVSNSRRLPTVRSRIFSARPTWSITRRHSVTTVLRTLCSRGSQGARSAMPSSSRRSFRTTRSRHEEYSTSLVVSAERRGQGGGRQLVAAVEDHARGIGGHGEGGGSGGQHRAEKLYTRLGYQPGQVLLLKRVDQPRWPNRHSLPGRRPVADGGLRVPHPSAVDVDSPPQDDDNQRRRYHAPARRVRDVRRDSRWIAGR